MAYTKREAYLCRNTGNDLASGSVVSVIPGQPMVPIDSDPNPARNYPQVGDMVLDVRTPDIDDQLAQDPDLTLIATSPLYSNDIGICVRVDRAPALMMSDLVGDEESDTVTETQYQGIPLGICADSPYLHRGGSLHRMIDWVFPSNDATGGGVAFVDIVRGETNAWFKASSELFSNPGSSASGILSHDEVDLYYMGKDTAGKSTLIPSHSLTEDTPLKVVLITWAVRFRQVLMVKLAG